MATLYYNILKSKITEKCCALLEVELNNAYKNIKFNTNFTKITESFNLPAYISLQ